MAQDGDSRVGLGEEGHYDQDIYEMSRSRGRYDDYVTSIPATDEQEVCSEASFSLEWVPFTGYIRKFYWSEMDN